MKRHVRSFSYLLVIAISLVAAISAAAQSPPQSDEAATDATRPGSLSGTVVDQNGQPLPNAAVSARGYGSTIPVRTATTDNQGNFEIRGLTPVAYLVSASLPAYVLAPRDPDANPIGYYRVGDSVRLQLIKGGVITGTVKKSNGDPIVSISVRATMVRDAKGQAARYAAFMRGGTTDDRGVYRIYGLSSGTYIVAAGGTGSSNGYFVDAYGDNVPTYAPSATRDSATEVVVNAGEETANVDISYRQEAGHKVSGTASAAIVSDQPYGFNILLTSNYSGSQLSFPGYQPPGARGFLFSGVPDGDFRVVAQSYLPSGEWVLSQPLTVKVRGADVTGLELIANPLSSITGSVVLEDSKAAECQGKRRPVFGETVISPWHNEKNTPPDQPLYIWSLGAPTFADKAGSFVLRNLASGQYRFNARPMAKYWYLKSISWPATARSAQTNQPPDAARNWTTLRAGERLSGLTITFAAGAASFRGQIVAADGQKLPSRIFVYLVPAERENSENILRYFVSLAAEDGTFALTNLAPGRYWLIARPAGEGDSNMLSKLRLPDETELRAKLLRDGENAKVETQLKPCENISEFHLPLNKIP